jgi:predicted transcriptional regulator
LWRGGPGTVAEIRERLPVTLAYNTVLTILRNLENKGFVGHEDEGRLFTYFPAISEQSVQGSALERLVTKLFRGSPAGIVTHLVEAESLSTDDLRELHTLLEKRLSQPKAAPAENSGKSKTLSATRKRGKK